MNKALVVAATAVLLTPIVVAQPELPVGAEALDSRLLARVGAETRAWIRGEAAREASADTLSEATATAAVKANRSLPMLPASDVTALAFLVQMEAAKSAREDLKVIMDRVKLINEAKAEHRQAARRVRANAAPTAATGAAISPQRRPAASTRAPVRAQPVSKAEFDALLDDAKDNLDSLNEMGETESLRLQMAMDRYTRLMSTISNLMKKMSDTAASITQNLK